MVMVNLEVKKKKEGDAVNDSMNGDDADANTDVGITQNQERTTSNDFTITAMEIKRVRHSTHFDTSKTHIHSSLLLCIII